MKKFNRYVRAQLVGKYITYWMFHDIEAYTHPIKEGDGNKRFVEKIIGVRPVMKRKTLSKDAPGLWCIETESGMEIFIKPTSDILISD